MSLSQRYGVQFLRVCSLVFKFNNRVSFSSYTKIKSSLPKPLLSTKENLIFNVQQCCRSSTVVTAENDSLVDEEKDISPSQMYEKVIDFKAITEGNSELETKLRVLCLEHEVFRQEGVLVPRLLNQEQWKHLLTLDSRSKRRKYYKFLFGIEIKRDKKKAVKEQKAKERIEQKLIEAEEGDEEKHIKYGLGYNSILLRVYDTTINHHYNSNVIRAIQFGQKMVIDCDYDEFMTPQETSNCAKQLMLAFSRNRLHSDPLDIHLCNAKQTNPTMKHLLKFIPNLYETYFPLNVHSQSYLDLFPKQDIVYLTPHCRTELDKFDHDAVYVVGALVDKTNNEPLSLAKAKKEGLHMAKLPLDKYLQWSGGSGKSLTINQMVDILCDIRTTDDWEKALSHVPRRKINNEIFSSQPEDFKRQKPFQVRAGGRPYFRKMNKNY